MFTLSIKILEHLSFHLDSYLQLTLAANDKEFH